LATAFIIWDREKKVALPQVFPTSADATAHATRLASKDTRSGKTDTKDVLTVTI
jgi:hypothetical protein